MIMEIKISQLLKHSTAHLLLQADAAHQASIKAVPVSTFINAVKAHDKSQYK